MVTSRGLAAGRPVPYEAGGRARQKQRTREALVAALHELMETTPSPTVDEVAHLAGISRTTAYRYFPDQNSLIAAGYPEVAEKPEFIGDRAEDVAARVRVVVDLQLDLIAKWEPQLRAALRNALDDHDRTPLRGGRAIGWFADALTVLSPPWSRDRVQRTAIRLRATAGIEAWIWLLDVAGVSTGVARSIIRDNADAVLQSALDTNR
ncbi:TetR/AcrR family transcriptional regulator [Gordonia sp. CPCC 205515]|uniref:TetR/AcrR family transcriptional regulator n=1 Tax=Gordonia sp. CPCC 205515 TaxID=3140791 RepID=UPI003AF3A8B3